MADKMKELREGIASALSVVPDVQVTARYLANPTPPAAHVVPGTTLYHRAMGNGHSDWNLTVQGFAAFVSDEGAQEIVDRWIAEEGAYSFKAAIEDDLTLGGVADDLIVRENDGYTLFPRPDGQVFLGSEWTVYVIASDR